MKIFNKRFSFVFKDANWEVQHDIQDGHQSRKSYIIVIYDFYRIKLSVYLLIQSVMHRHDFHINVYMTCFIFS